MILSVFFTSVLYLTTLPYRRISLHYSPGPEILTWTLISRNLSFKCKLDTSYTLSDTSIPHCDSHKDLGLILSADLSRNKHYKTITAHGYKVLGLIRQTFLSSYSTFTMVKLYVSLV